MGASSGLGLLILHANARMQTDTVFAALAVLAVLSIALWTLVDAADAPPGPLGARYPASLIGHPMRLPLPAAILAAAFAALLRRARPPWPSPAPPAAAKAEPLTVLLDWFVNPDHAALVIAREKGFFAAAGLDVTLVEPADPSAPPRLVAAGQGDIAVTYQPNLYQQVAEGLPVNRIGTAVATPLNSLVALADGPVKSSPT